MIQLAAKFDARKLTRQIRRLPKDLLKVESRAINQQMRASIGGTGKSKTLPVVGMVRRMSQAWSVKPQRRLRNRMFVPRTAWAKPQRSKLFAEGLTLFDVLPMRYFTKGVPGGATVKESGPDSQGRTPYGGAFKVTLRSGATGAMRKLRPQKWGGGGGRNRNPQGYLPIGWAQYVDVSGPAYQIRNNVLKDLARYFPTQMDAAFSKYFRRKFSA